MSSAPAKQSSCLRIVGKRQTVLEADIQIYLLPIAPTPVFPSYRLQTPGIRLILALVIDESDRFYLTKRFYLPLDRFKVCINPLKEIEIFALNRYTCDVFCN